MTLPLHPDKHGEPPLVTVEDSWEYFGGDRDSPPVPRDVVLCYQNDLFAAVADRPGAETVDGLYADFCVLPDADGSQSPVGVAGRFGVGAPAAAMAMESLRHHGARRFLSVGLAGTLQPDVAVGDLVVPTEALRDEGTSHHYVEPEETIRPADALVRAARSHLDAGGVDYHEGPTWTTDAVYRETAAEVERYRERGVVTVEMELAATAAVAAHHGLDAGGLFVVSDRLDVEWEPRFEDAFGELETAFDYGVGILSEA